MTSEQIEGQQSKLTLVLYAFLLFVFLLYAYLQRSLFQVHVAVLLGASLSHQTSACHSARQMQVHR